ncbi:class I SAM-dependent DNA methyltransferase [Shumkonia mesophila]|uniref:class I SAM-dependent DNA methyltransferase n=1 Tax=Shumkonia mesophila TaxID=2838854 RepID=UPI0029341408|nr:methyltransferase domain-containing protein [Shumkonia mesophila]
MSCCDLAAHRRLEFGLALMAGGDPMAAVSVFEQALELAPEWPEARFALADALHAAGRRDDAVAAYAAYLARDAADVMGAAIRLALLGAAPQPEQLPPAYVKTLFDQYAPRFEESLIGQLAYQAPFQLRAALDAVAPVTAPEGRVLDLGCGTGLAGEALRHRAAWLEGVDLSPAMVEQARRKGIYDRLEIGDAVAALMGAKDRFDSVVAADVMIYFGNLAPLLAAVRRALVPGGCFAFSAQKAAGDGFVLGGDHRYSHSAPYLRAAAEAAGFVVERLEEAVSRTEAGTGVPGFIVVLRDRPEPAVTAAGAVDSANMSATGLSGTPPARPH